MKRSVITECALSFIGTPWRHMGRTRAGVDCVGLLAAIWDELEFTPTPEIPPYKRQPDGSLLSYFRKYMVQAPMYRLKPGTAVVFAFRGSPYHAGVVIDPERRSMVHAYARDRKVVCDIIDHGNHILKPICAWDYPGVTDG